MSIIIASLIHAVCKVAIASDPSLVSAVGIKSVSRTSGSSRGEFDVVLEEGIDPKTAILLASINAVGDAPPGGVTATIDSADTSTVHVTTAASVVASANLTSSGDNGGAGSGFQSMTHPATGEYDFELLDPLDVKNNAYAEATILVTPGATKVIPSWTVSDSTHFKVLLTDTSGMPADAAFSLALLPNDAGPHPADFDFVLVVMDLSNAGSIGSNG